MTNAEIIRKISEECKLRALSPQTEEEYQRSFRMFLQFYGNQPAEEMAETEIRKYLLHLAEEGKSPGTINVHNSSLRFVFGAVLEKALNYKRLPRQRSCRKIPDIMTKSQIVKFFSVIDNLRDRAMFETVYGAGLRISEVAKLRIKDIDGVEMRIFVNKGKGGKDRYTLLSQRNLEILREYWKAYRPPEFLFYSRNYTGTHMTSKSVQDAFKKYRIKAGLSENFTVHTLRHCFATHLMESGVDLYRIKNLLGQSYIQTTTFYLHLSSINGEIKSPLDTLPKKRGRKPKQGASNA